MKICCVIPAFNEAGNLTKLTQKIIKELTYQKISFKIIFIIQGETKSLAIIEKLQKRFDMIEYLYFPKPLGVGLAYKIGFQKVDDSWSHVLTLDADLNHKPEELFKFIRAYKKTHADIIIGSRFIRGGKTHDKRLWKIMASRLVNKIISSISTLHVADKTSGFRLIKTELIKIIRGDLSETGYPSYLELILLAQKHKAKIIEIPITYRSRIWGKSKMGLIKTSFDYFRFLVNFLLSSYIPKLAVFPQ